MMGRIGLIWFLERKIVVRFDMKKIENRVKRMIEFACLVCCVCVLSASGGVASGEFGSRDWAQSLKEASRPHIFKEMQKLYKENADQEEYESAFNPRPRLQIFVSRSMPLPLLKSYAKAAERYNAVLTFRGLPDGQMQIQKLTELVREINGDDGKCAMNIDPESFTLFEIDTVPSIVLSENIGATNTFANKAPLYDKVTGGVTLSYALNLFAEDGVLSDEANAIIEGAQK